VSALYGPRSYGPLAPASEIRALVERALKQEDLASFCARAQVHPRRLYDIMAGRTREVSWSLADRIITYGLGDPSLWWTRPALREVICSPIDERYRDRQTSPEAVERETSRSRWQRWPYRRDPSRRRRLRP
jgi:hypothetical protein